MPNQNIFTFIHTFLILNTKIANIIFLSLKSRKNVNVVKFPQVFRLIKLYVNIRGDALPILVDTVCMC